MELDSIQIAAPGNLAATLAKVRAEVEKEKGTLVGDEQSGTITSCAFAKNDIQGEYSLKDGKLIIKIVKKPLLVPFSMIQKEIVETFQKCAVD